MDGDSLSSASSARDRRSQFDVEYVIQRLVQAVDRLTDKVEMMATKTEVGAALANVDSRLEKLERKVSDGFDAVRSELAEVKGQRLPQWAQALALAIFALIVSAIEWALPILIKHSP